MTDATSNTNGTPTSVSALAAGKMGAGVDPERHHELHRDELRVRR